MIPAQTSERCWSLKKHPKGEKVSPGKPTATRKCVSRNASGVYGQGLYTLPPVTEGFG